MSAERRQSLGRQSLGHEGGLCKRDVELGRRGEQGCLGRDEASQDISGKAAEAEC